MTQPKAKELRGILDRSRWQPGPWDGEPDKREWRDAATGLPCLMVRNGFGVWCGYVGVGPSHPCHGTAYGDIAHLDVHGNLTFAGRCQPVSMGELRVCHTPEPGEPKDIWWLGFDCGHGFDLMPVNARLFAGWPADSFGMKYRDVAYVEAECTRLAFQLQEMSDAP